MSIYNEHNFKITLEKHFKEYQLGKDDCWTLIQDIFKENDIIIPDYHSINTSLKREKYKDFLLDSVKYTELDKPQRGAVLLFSGNPIHCGICLNEKEFIHRDIGINTRIERIERYAKAQGIYLASKTNS